MARRVRIQMPGAIYHLVNRGDRLEEIFIGDEDRELFIRTLGDTCAKTGWRVHAFVLMPNHFHLLVETPEPNLVSGMKWLLGTYTTRFNVRHRLVGHLFRGRYRSQMIDGRGEFLTMATDYLHLNPARAGLLDAPSALRSFRWSSFPFYLSPPEERPSWLRVDQVMKMCGMAIDSSEGRRRYEDRLEGIRSGCSTAEFDELRHGWCLGDDAFRKHVVAAVTSRLGPNHYGPEVQADAQKKAETIIDEELHLLRWENDDLGRHLKGHPAKLSMATRLRRETTMTLDWIAQRLQMGTKGHLSHLLYWQRRGTKPPKTTKSRKLRPIEPGITATPRVALASAECNSQLSIPMTDPLHETSGSSLPSQQSEAFGEPWHSFNPLCD